MKRYIIFLFLIFTITSFGQFHSPAAMEFTVVVKDTTVCYGGTAIFKASPIDSMVGTYNFKWLFNGVEITDSVRQFLIVKNVSALDSGSYQCVLSDSIRHAVDTSSRAHLRIRAQLHVDTLYRYNALGCPSDSNGQMKIKVSGGHPPYTYNWGGGSYHQLDTLGVGFPRGTYTITVTDADTTHCVSREFTILALKLHKITFHMNPPDTVYLTNPFLTVTIQDTAVKHLDNWNWQISDGSPKVSNVNPDLHEFTKIGQFSVVLNFTDNIGGQLCDSTIIDTILVKTLRLFVPNAITPGTGDVNGSLNIRELNPTDNKPLGDNLDLSQIYLSTEMFIYTRSGRKVFDKVNYKSGDWDGGNLSAGVYYYILKCHGQYGDEVYRGAITLIRK
jgi:PKD repeat protein